MTRYAIGDIHGQCALLEQALDRIAADGAGPGDEVIFLGDLVDSGPDGCGVIALIAEGRAAGQNWTALRGNHDRMFLDFLEGGTSIDGRTGEEIAWPHEKVGGYDTAASYGVDARPDRPWTEIQRELRAAVPETHLEFLRAMPVYAERGPLLFVHAGIRPGIALDRQGETDLLWIRDDFLDHTAPHPWLVVHGHTALQAPHHFGNRIDLDSGAGHGRALTAAAFEGSECFILTSDGRRLLQPT